MSNIAVHFVKYCTERRGDNDEQGLQDKEEQQWLVENYLAFR